MGRAQAGMRVSARVSTIRATRDDPVSALMEGARPGTGPTSMSASRCKDVVRGHRQGESDQVVADVPGGSHPRSCGGALLVGAQVGAAAAFFLLEVAEHRPRIDAQVARRLRAVAVVQRG